MSFNLFKQLSDTFKLTFTKQTPQTKVEEESVQSHERWEVR